MIRDCGAERYHPNVTARIAGRVGASVVLVAALVSVSFAHEWVARYNEPGNSADCPDAIAVDRSGNIYVTGASSSAWSKPDMDYDFATVKYTPAGVEEWIARYKGPGNSTDSANAVAVDNSGNVCVAGTSKGVDTDFDCTTIKYNLDGVEQWVARYNGPADSTDGAMAVAVDRAGNVYVAGYSVGSGTGFDYVTIKYSAAGVEQWVARYNGPGNGADGANAIAVDELGNVYVTGASLDSIHATYFTFSSYATIKYNPDGIEQWVARYNGPEAGSNSARDIALDGSGNVYVTGYSTGPGTDRDYATVKYDSYGVQQWAARYNGSGDGTDDARAIAVDSSGNAYVAGHSWGSGKTYYATVKYDPAGVQQWVALLLGGVLVYGIALDAQGNACVTGVGNVGGFATVKYSPTGIEEWVMHYPGPGGGGGYATAIATDPSGNVCIAGFSPGPGTGWDYTTIKYSPAGAQQWVARYNGPWNGDDVANAIAVDVSGDAWVAGASMNPNTHCHEYATAKYNPAGTEAWAMRDERPQIADNAANALAIDSGGSVYVTGVCVDSIHAMPARLWSSYATIKYGPAGTLEWIARYDGPGTGRNEATAVMLDGSGNVCVTGYSTGTGYDYATIQYDRDGIERWAARYNGPGDGDDVAMAMAVDRWGNIYVTGRSMGSGTDYDYATVKYSPDGVEQWIARYDGPAHWYDAARAIAVDNAGNVYVTGESQKQGFGYDYATIKYDSAGGERWVARYRGLGQSTGENRATAIEIDNAGNVCVTGYSTGASSGCDYATVGYDPAGVQRWVVRYSGPVGGDNKARAMALDGAGDVYVTGESMGLGTGYDYATVKYNSEGAEQWIARYDGPGSGNDKATAIALDNSGGVYVTGGSTGVATGNNASTGYQYATVKYNSQSGVAEASPRPPVASVLEVAGPHPTSAGAEIRYGVPPGTAFSIAVYDVAGGLVRMLVRGVGATGRGTIRWDGRDGHGWPAAPGVYFVRLTSGTRSADAKIIKLN